MPLEENALENEIEGYCYQINSNVLSQLPDEEDFPAMPNGCPNCQQDYSDRASRISPIRTFRTGLNKFTQILSKHLINCFEGDSRKLIAFSDSREAAAILANGVEGEHWSDTIRAIFFGELLKKSGNPLIAAQAELIKQYRLDPEKLDEICAHLHSEAGSSEIKAAISHCYSLITEAFRDINSLRNSSKVMQN